ncbi:MAG TPA: PEGA domain-containing protein [bacterium]
MICHLIKVTAVTLLLSMTLSLVLPAELCARPQQLTGDEPPGYLMLLTPHAGLEIKIDNQPVGRTPDSLLTLAAGPHKVAVEHPDRVNWFEEDWFADVRILPGDTLRVPVVFRKTFSINSQPYGATVAMDGAAMGETPIFFKLTEDEIKPLTLSKTGYRDTTFTIGHDQRRFFYIALAVPKRAVDLSLKPASDDHHTSPTKLILYSASALVVLSGGLALYFRDRGNDKYNSYLNTGDPELIERYYKDAKHFDRLAAVSFGAFQISFVASFYLLLKEANKEK